MGVHFFAVNLYPFGVLQYSLPRLVQAHEPTASFMEFAPPSTCSRHSLPSGSPGSLGRRPVSIRRPCWSSGCASPQNLAYLAATLGGSSRQLLRDAPSRPRRASSYDDWDAPPSPRPAIHYIFLLDGEASGRQGYPVTSSRRREIVGYLTFFPRLSPRYTAHSQKKPRV